MRTDLKSQLHSDLNSQPKPEDTDWTHHLVEEGQGLVADLDAHPGARRLFEGRIDTARYTRYLVQAYHCARWTAPLLADSAERLRRQGGHPVVGDLFMHQAAEKRGHERWLLADLRGLGWSSERVEGAGRCPAVKAYIAWNRFTALSGIPTAFLGTAFVLEYLAVHRAPQAVAKLLEAQAIPNISKAVTFLRNHGEEDGAHVKALRTLLRAMADPREQAAVLLSARICRSLYSGLFSPEVTRGTGGPTP